MAARVLAHGRTIGRGTGTLLLAAGIACVFGDGLWHEGSAGTLGLILRDLPADVGFALIVTALAANRRPVLEAKPLVWLGAISFGVYLWHMPLMLFERGIGLFPEHQPVAAVLAVSALTLPVAWASWVFVERPLLRRAPKPSRSAGGLPGAWWPAMTPEPAVAQD
jgi:peptidoglycan/LPS O-acetylase OafA/YrhL